MTEQCIENEESIEVNLANALPYETIDIQGSLTPFASNSVLLILNQKIDIAGVFLKLWDIYKIRVCADGGANMLYDYFGDDEELKLKYIPNYIIGDLDSLDSDVKDYYLSHNVVVIKQTTQYSTDFMKSVHLISLHFNSPTFRELINNEGSTVDNNYGIELLNGIHDLYNEMKQKSRMELFPKINVLALGGIDGRFDQTIHSITQLYVLSKSDSYINLSYLTPTDFIILLPKGATLLEYSTSFRKDCLGNCGLLPLAVPTEIIETRGLKWDVSNWDTSLMTGKVSSSNRFVGTDKCYINIKDSMVLNIEIKLKHLLKYL